jgi:hypothetical protein
MEDIARQTGMATDKLAHDLLDIRLPDRDLDVYPTVADAMRASECLHRMRTIPTLEHLHDVRCSFPFASAPLDTQIAVHQFLDLMDQYLHVPFRQHNPLGARYLSVMCRRLPRPVAPTSLADVLGGVAAITLFFWNVCCVQPWVCFLSWFLHLLYFLITGPRLEFHHPEEVNKSLLTLLGFVLSLLFLLVAPVPLLGYAIVVTRHPV